MKAIKMLAGQEGPAVSRVPGQVLTIGDQVDAAEARRLIDAGFAEEAADEASAPAPKAKSAGKAAAKAG